MVQTMLSPSSSMATWPLLAPLMKEIALSFAKKEFEIGCCCFVVISLMQIHLHQLLPIFLACSFYDTLDSQVDQAKEEQEDGHLHQVHHHHHHVV